MAKRKRHFRSGKAIKAGLPPGSLVYSGERTGEATITTFNYNSETIREQLIEDLELKEGNSDGLFRWINLNAIHDVDMVEHFGKAFGLHSLLLEDIVSAHQRPKIEYFDNYLFIVVRMLDYDPEHNEIHSEQVSFVLLKDTLLTFQEKAGDTFNPIRERLRHNKGKLRTNGTDYLLYALLDSIVDNYFIILESIGEKMEELELELFDSPTQNTLVEIHKMKREMIYLKKNIWPMRELVNNLHKNEEGYFKQGTTLFLRDLYDHVIQVIDTTETFRDILTGLQEMYLSSISNRTNAIMKVLTIIATIFIPLTFIVGVYGMNFEYMPELEWRYGYLFIWIVMLCAMGGMLWYFRKKDWI